MKKITLLFSLFLTFTFYNSYGQSPRADALASSDLPYYFTFEADDAGSVLAPFTVNADGSDYNQGVDITYGVANPDGTANSLVAKIIRPDDQRFGGFEDFKFQTLSTSIDFSVYHKWTIDVFIPTGQDFSGSLAPEVSLTLMDYNANFWERWTVISKTIDEADFGSWVTLEFDGSSIAAVDTYTNVTLVFGGAGHGESGIFYVKDLMPTESFSNTPRADALASSGLPYYFTFEADDAGSVLAPFTINADGSDYNQGVDITYGVANPDGTANSLVAEVIRPDDQRFGGFEDFKFQTLTTSIDFSVYHKWTIDVFIPTGQDFSGSLAPQVSLTLMDYNANFWERWTVFSKTIDEADFGSWVTLEFDGSSIAAIDTYTNVTLVFGGAGHAESGTFYVKDLIPVSTTLSTAESSKISFKMYPNPSQDNWTIKTQNIEISDINVYNILGKNILSITPNASQVTIEGTNLTAGLYFAEIRTAKGTEKVKLVKR